jgi:hypothetical protein
MQLCVSFQYKYENSDDDGLLDDIDNDSNEQSTTSSDLLIDADIVEPEASNDDNQSHLPIGMAILTLLGNR